MDYKLLFCCVVVFTFAEEAAGGKEPRLFFVSTFSSTSLTTTTTTINTELTCLKLSATAYAAACTGRRKKRSAIDTSKDGDGEQISVTKVKKSSAEPDSDFIQDTKAKEQSDQRNARFAWYYMTTTVAALYTVTDTTTAYTSTISVTANACTPEFFNGCGRSLF
jgi:hypothetical protein